MVLGAGLGVAAAAFTLWAVVDVARTEAFVLYLDGWKKPVWLLIACVPVVGAAYWIHLAKPTNEVEQVLPLGGWMLSDEQRW
jgi:hypothetical protein